MLPLVTEMYRSIQENYTLELLELLGTAGRILEDLRVAGAILRGEALLDSSADSCSGSEYVVDFEHVSPPAEREGVDNGIALIHWNDFTFFSLCSGNWKVRACYHDHITPIYCQQWCTC